MIIILGSGRSGTTWLGKLFDSHPDTMYLHEPDSVVRNGTLPDFPETPSDEEARAAADYLDRLARVRTPGVIGVPPHFSKRWRGSVAQGAYRTALAGAKAMRRVTGRGWPGPPVPDFAGAGAIPVIKTVSGLGRAPLYAAAKPEARLIHVARHPGGRIASLKRGIAKGLMDPDPMIDALFEEASAGAYPFARVQVDRWSLAEQLAFSWMVQNDRVAALMADRANYRFVAYEELAAAPAETLADLFAFAGLPEDTQSTAFVTGLSEAPDRPDGYHDVSRRPQGGIARWRDELSTDEIDAILSITRHARDPNVRAIVTDG